MRVIQRMMGLSLLAFLGCSGSQSSPTINNVANCTLKDGIYTAYTCTSTTSHTKVHICVDDCNTLANLPWCQELIYAANTSRNSPLGCAAPQFNSGCEVVGVNDQVISTAVDCSQYSAS